jgi:hypothetical protein
VVAAGGLVGSTTVIGGVSGFLYAYGERPSALASFATYSGVGVSSFEVGAIGTASSISDVGAMSMTGAMLGAEGGIVLLPALGIGYGVGTLISPW